jgi:peroxiredoxin
LDQTPDDLKPLASIAGFLNRYFPRSKGRAMRLNTGDKAPGFSATALSGEKVTVGDRNPGHVLLSFYRYASCPFCNLRVREVNRAWADLANRGISALAVFHSAPERLLRYMEDQTFNFPLIPNPELDLYRAYGVEMSWSGFLRGLLNVRDAMRAFGRGHLPGPMDGPKNTLPADFVISPSGLILDAYYGKDMTDHIPLSRVLQAHTRPTATSRPLLADLPRPAP